MEMNTGYEGDLPDAFSWKDSTPGKTTLEGQITFIGDPFEREDTFSPTKKIQSVFPIVIDDETTLWICDKKDVDSNPRPDRKYQAIALAVQESGATELLAGGTLKIQHSESKDSKKGNPEKIYIARYTPPVKGMAMAANVTAEEDIDPF